MHKYTQDEFNALPVIDGIRQCPTGDYTAISNFGWDCIFGEWCIFGECCIFGWDCSFEGLAFNPHTTVYFIRINNIGSRSDGCYIFNAQDGLYVRSGCFFGTAKEFLKRVHEKHADTIHEKTYKLAVQMAKIQFGRE